MKRTLLIPLLCMFFMQPLLADDFSRSIQATVGVPFVIDPAEHCGVDRNKMCGMDGMFNPNYPNSSNMYTPDLFTYTVENYTGYIHTYLGVNTVGRVFTITPVSTGITSFKMSVKKVKSITNSSYTWDTHYITYTINIVDVTSIGGLEDFSLTAGETETLTPTITNQFAEASLTWKSNNKSVATVDADGKVTAVGVGTSKITCTAQNGVSTNCNVTVNPIYATGITLNETAKEMVIGDNLQLTATVLPSTATDKSVTWSSNNESVAMVNENGLVYAVGTGACKITATANDGSDKTASCMVVVSNSAMQGDMNGDGVITVTDVTKLIRVILEQQ